MLKEFPSLGSQIMKAPAGSTKTFKQFGPLITGLSDLSSGQRASAITRVIGGKHLVPPFVNQRSTGI